MSIKRSDMVAVGQLLELDATGLRAVRNLGQKSIDEIETQLRNQGYRDSRRYWYDPRIFLLS